jgi:hypothetical protein
VQDAFGLERVELFGRLLGRASLAGLRPMQDAFGLERVELFGRLLVPLMAADCFRVLPFIFIGQIDARLCCCDRLSIFFDFA